LSLNAITTKGQTPFTKGLSNVYFTFIVTKSVHVLVKYTMYNDFRPKELVT